MAEWHVRHFCEGGCGGSVSKGDFEKGKTTCGAPTCPDHGKPFIRKHQCPKCEKWLKEEEHCDCAATHETPGFH